MTNAINWFEIFVSDLDRALVFYEKALGATFRRESMTGRRMAIFPYAPPGVGGAIVEDKVRRAPASEDGARTLAYLNLDGKLDAVLARVPAAGGQIVLPKTDIGDPGFIATVRDPDGNLVGLHSERGA